MDSMQFWPLRMTRLIDYAARHHGQQEIVSRAEDGSTHRSNWAATRRRARQLAGALRNMGVRPGDRVGTLAWNSYRHLEAWFGIMGMGGVAHTVNPRLFDQQLIYILNDAEDRVLLFDRTFLPIVERIAPRLTSVEKFILLGEAGDMPASSIDLLCYETVIAAAEPIDWVELDETAPAGLCYTSGTTGNPKGVLYTHRSNMLLTMTALAPDAFNISSRSVIFPIVPMYHSNAWGLPFTAAAAGTKLVLTANFEPQGIIDLIRSEGVTLSAAVPTIWQGVFEKLETGSKTLGSLREVLIGGTAAPRSMIRFFEKALGVTVTHAWGMTELSPIGTIGKPSAEIMRMTDEERLDVKVKQGRAIMGVDLRLCDDDGNDVPHDGASPGRLMVRGGWVVQRYFKAGADAVDHDGWFDTGDIATIDAFGFVQLVDRAKDLIKSGGEWISSVALECAAMEHDGVKEAAVIALPHPKWDERPLLIAVRKPCEAIGKDGLQAFLAEKVARWWLPDDIIFVDELPYTGTGKVDKVALRRRFVPS